MNYKEFYNEMQNGKLVSTNWHNILSLIENEYSNNENIDKYLKILVIYFALIDDGNVYMPLDKDILNEKINTKIFGLKAEAEENDEENSNLYEDLSNEITSIIKNVDEIINFTDVLSENGANGLFVIEDSKLYTRKHFNSVKRIKNSIKRLFINNPSKTNGFKYKDYLKEGVNFKLSDDQALIIERGYYNNLLVTGGPGTGKTTSIFYLLLSLLIDNPDLNIYLTAPSGKAASRMKDSIIREEGKVNSKVESTIERIKKLDEYTIHRLLGYSQIQNGFNYNLKNQFEDNSIFVIDEASMIDVNMFANLLDAIPDNARVFILGDKNQLPSVECGAVFGALLEDTNLKNNIVELTESKRFDGESDIYKLSETINTDGDLTYINDKWKSYEDFNFIEELSQNKPIYYYSDSNDNESTMIDAIVDKWYKKFYLEKNLYELCEVVYDENKENLINALDGIWNISEEARILCASNKSKRGIKNINNTILKNFYSKKDSISGFFRGELLIVTQNDKILDLYNGDCGVTIKFKDDNTLYLMLKKGTNLILDDKKVENKIFRINDYLFYPIRLINSENVLPAFAITIHKSQGSDYNNILVVLPRLKDNSLLNRQIVYTAITRTKGNTYILSNQDNLEKAKNTSIIRDTF